jgi:hypothetical protein
MAVVGEDDSFAAQLKGYGLDLGSGLHHQHVTLRTLDCLVGGRAKQPSAHSSPPPGADYQHGSTGLGAVTDECLARVAVSLDTDHLSLGVLEDGPGLLPDLGSIALSQFAGVDRAITFEMEDRGADVEDVHHVKCDASPFGFPGCVS